MSESHTLPASEAELGLGITDAEPARAFGAEAAREALSESSPPASGSGAPAHDPEAAGELVSQVEIALEFMRVGAGTTAQVAEGGTPPVGLSKAERDFLATLARPASRSLRPVAFENPKLAAGAFVVVGLAFIAREWSRVKFLRAQAHAQEEDHRQEAAPEGGAEKGGTEPEPENPNDPDVVHSPGVPRIRVTRSGFPPPWKPKRPKT